MRSTPPCPAQVAIPSKLILVRLFTAAARPPGAPRAWLHAVAPLHWEWAGANAPPAWRRLLAMYSSDPDVGLVRGIGTLLRRAAAALGLSASGDARTSAQRPQRSDTARVAVDNKPLPARPTARQRSWQETQEAAPDAKRSAAVLPRSAAGAATEHAATALVSLRALVLQGGMAGVYVVWFIAAWFTLTYGELIYQLLGDSAEARFASDWATGVAIENAAQWRSVLQSAVQNVALLLLLERVGLAAPRSWLETHLDHMSIQATYLSGKAQGWWERMALHLEQKSRVERTG